MYAKMAKRVLVETDKRLLWKFLWTMGFKGARSVLRHKKRLKKGQVFPPFLYVSIINSCNLRCQGCWVDVTAKQSRISLDAMNKLINEAKTMGNAFFGIVGGEPLLHPELLSMLAQNPDCYFQVFTNGHLLTDEIAQEMRRLGNVTPLVSVEGNEIISDQRRGGSGVWNKTMQGLQNCVRHRLLTGVATSVCQSNIDDLLTEEWLDRLIELGVFYAWFYDYHPMGPNPCPELCLTPEQQLRLRRFVVEMRTKKPIAIVDAYHDGEGRALCPAVTGLSHHINPWGGIEPCPVIQLAKESIHDEDTSLTQKFFQSEFLRGFRDLTRQTTRGCLVLERPDLLRQLAMDHGAQDATARQTVLEELERMQARTSQYHPGQEIPEKSWAYRLAKRFLFNDFGVYSNPQDDERHSRCRCK